MGYRLGIYTAMLLSASTTLSAEDFFRRAAEKEAEKEQEELMEVDGQESKALFEIGCMANTSGDFLPYQLYANKQGRFAPIGTETYNRAFYSHKLSKEKWSLEAGGDLYLYHTKKEPYYAHVVHLQQLYVKGNWGKYTVQLGSKEEDAQFVSNLSSGNMVWSGNARPAPGLRIGMDDFVSTFITGYIFEMKLNFWWGKQTDGKLNTSVYEQYEANYGQEVDDPKNPGHKIISITKDKRQHAKVENAWVHRKSFFIRTTSDKPVFATFGLEHAVMYGGTVNDMDCSEGTNWVRSMLGGSGKKEGNQFNHVLGQDYRIDFRGNLLGVGLYKQHYADDMEGGLFKNGADGLWGMEITLPKTSWLKHIVIEYLHTTNQGGVVYANDEYTKLDKKQIFRTAGNSNFYHDQHMGAWTHYGMILGNPLLSSPLYNTDSYPDMASNMLRAYHLAFEGNIGQKWNYAVKAQHTDSWGTPFAPFGEIRGTTSVAVEAACKVNNHWKVEGAFGMDKGSLYGDNTGFHLNIQYTL
ncbi:MAG: capsule assembly Wzi family protein [Bacteroidales bacterium]|nr:capsule assembly Wzi family protein [Bacteroidales bacterium]